MAEELKMIQRDEYPEPRLFDRDGNLYAEVSVPTTYQQDVDLRVKCDIINQIKYGELS